MSSGYTGNTTSTYSNRPRITDEDAKNAAVSLARLMERQLGYCEGHIDPVALRLFIRAYWSRVSTCAHTIHDQDCA